MNQSSTTGNLIQSHHMDNIHDNEVMRHDSDELPLSVTRLINVLCDEYEQALNPNTEKISLATGMLPFVQRLGDVGKRELIVELVEIARERLQTAGVDDIRIALLAENADFESEIDAVLEQYVDSDVTVLFEGPAYDPARHQMTPRAKKSRALHLRCPHCSNHVEVISDAQSDSIDCDVCGTNFSLVDRSKETRLADALQQIDRFELVSRLGVGGFGTVWKARDLDLDRIVAIKIPRHGQLSEDELDLFFREARSVAQLRHPNIVPVHEVGREDDTVFIVSDLIRGISLADQLTGDHPSPREAATLCMTIAAALEHAHSQGVIHRDLKPSNVMIDDNGQPHIMDFGLAKREADEITVTTDGQIIGTPAYMSPEQADGRSAWADRRSDIYSLGVILFELLTGELPFRGNAQLQVHQRLHEEAPSVLSLSKHIQLDLATICAKCLEREPGRRYQTAKDVKEELSRFLEKVPIKARPLSPIARLIRWATRRPLQAALAGLIITLAIAGPTVALFVERQRSRLAELLTEKDNLIQVREQERQSAVSEKTTLRAELDLWEGRAHPSDLWPPAHDFSPQIRQLTGLLAARRSVLESPQGETAETETQRARRLLALATLQEIAKRNEAATNALAGAVTALEVELAARPKSANLALALANSQYRLSVLVQSKDETESQEWLDLAYQTLTRASKDNPTDPRLAAALQDIKLRSSVAAGFEGSTEDFEQIATTAARLKGLWPKTSDEIYSLVCELAGLSPYLSETALGATQEPTAPTN